LGQKANDNNLMCEGVLISVFLWQFVSKAKDFTPMQNRLFNYVPTDADGKG
jgi:hypothetical protein